MGSVEQAAPKASAHSITNRERFEIGNQAIERHLPDLRRRARFLMHRKSDADDLTQDCMLRALPHLGTIDDLRAYLFQTLRNAYADRIALKLREAGAVTLEDADSQLIDSR